MDIDVEGIGKPNGVLTPHDLSAKADPAMKSFLSRDSLSLASLPLDGNGESQEVNGFHDHVVKPTPAGLPSFEAPKTVVVLKDEYSFGGIVNRETDLLALSWQENVLKSQLKTVCFSFSPCFSPAMNLFTPLDHTEKEDKK